LKIQDKLLLIANRKLYVSRRLAQQRMTFSDLEWPFHASRAIYAVAELLANNSYSTTGLGKLCINLFLIGKVKRLSDTESVGTL